MIFKKHKKELISWCNKTFGALEVGEKNEKRDKNILKSFDNNYIRYVHIKVVSIYFISSGKLLFFDIYWMFFHTDFIDNIG